MEITNELKNNELDHIDELCGIYEWLNKYVFLRYRVCDGCGITYDRETPITNRLSALMKIRYMGSAWSRVEVVEI